jgi:hypothetical protein
MVMAQVLHIFRQTVGTTAGRLAYRAQACGRQREDGLWEGWVEFVPDDGSVTLRTARETTQPTLATLEYWAAGLTPVYLDGALTRAIAARQEPPRLETPETPAYDEPAPARAIQPAAAPVERRSSEIHAQAPASGEPVLDPFSLYAKDEGLLRERLGALGARHLRTIVRAYDLVGDADVALETFSDAQLIEIVVAAVRRRMAA